MPFCMSWNLKVTPLELLILLSVLLIIDIIERW